MAILNAGLALLLQTKLVFLGILSDMLLIDNGSSTYNIVSVLEAVWLLLFFPLLLSHNTVLVVYIKLATIKTLLPSAVKQLTSSTFPWIRQDQDSTSSYKLTQGF